VNVRPFAPEGVTDGTIPSVLALTNGKGEQRDAVIAVHLDALGNIRSQTKFDSLSDPTEVQAFLSIFRRTGETRKRSNAPTVVVVGGMSVYANRLKTEVASALLRMAADEIGQSPPDEANYMNPEEFQMEQRIYDEKLKPCLVPLVMPSDVTARMYMDSDEGRAEHPNLPANARYALALARYTQNPLNAYAKLGKGLLGVTFMEHHQRLVSQLLEPAVEVTQADILDIPRQAAAAPGAGSRQLGLRHGSRLLAVCAGAVLAIHVAVCCWFGT
jgi:transcription elongation factor SPT6